MSERSTMQRIGDNFRTAAGLEKRTDQKPRTNGEDVSVASIVVEPKGGYTGISNSGVLTSQEQASLDRAAKAQERKPLDPAVKNAARKQVPAKTTRKRAAKKS
jgi:hypothetical protein